MKSPALLTTEDLTPRSHFALYWTFAHAWVLAKRRLVQIPRRPDELLIATIQPTMLVLLFRYVFGGAILVPGTSYANYLMAGVFVLASLVGSLATGIGLATDLQQGLIDRFRSLPMAHSAVLTGRTLADLVRDVFVVLVIWAVGLLVGFRPAGNPLAYCGNWLTSAYHLCFLVARGTARSCVKQSRSRPGGKSGDFLSLALWEQCVRTHQHHA